MSKTWLIFENGSWYSLDCTLHKAPKGHPRPVDSYIVTEHEGDFTIAARKAVHAVYDTAVRRGLDIEPVVAGFDLSERTRMDTGLSGQSGGMSFAVSFAQKLLRQDPGNVAATGVIKAGGRIGPVKGIETKIRTAASLVKGGGIILFPGRNMNDLPQVLVSELEQKNIQYLPVNTLDDVFDALFQSEPVKKKPDIPKTILYLLLLLIGCAVILGVWFKNQARERNQPDLSPGVESEKMALPVPQKPAVPPGKIQGKKADPVPEKTVRKNIGIEPLSAKENKTVQILPAGPVQPDKQGYPEKNESADKEDQINYKTARDKGFD